MFGILASLSVISLENRFGNVVYWMNNALFGQKSSSSKPLVDKGKIPVQCNHICLEVRFDHPAELITLVTLMIFPCLTCSNNVIHWSFFVNLVRGIIRSLIISKHENEFKINQSQSSHFKNSITTAWPVSRGWHTVQQNEDRHHKLQYMTQCEFAQVMKHLVKRKLTHAPFFISTNTI